MMLTSSTGQAVPTLVLMHFHNVPTIVQTPPHSALELSWLQTMHCLRPCSQLISMTAQHSSTACSLRMAFCTTRQRLKSSHSKSPYHGISPTLSSIMTCSSSSSSRPLARGRDISACLCGPYMAATVAACTVCWLTRCLLHSKLHKDHSAGLLQPMPDPELHWQQTMDFITQLTDTRDGWDAIFVVGGCLAKTIYVRPTTTDIKAPHLAQPFIVMISRYHKLLQAVVSDGKPKFTFYVRQAGRLGPNLTPIEFADGSARHASTGHTSWCLEKSFHIGSAAQPEASAAVELVRQRNHPLGSSAVGTQCRCPQTRPEHGRSSQ